MSRGSFLAGVALATLLTGCTMGPDFAKPEAPSKSQAYLPDGPGDRKSTRLNSSHRT